VKPQAVQAEFQISPAENSDKADCKDGQQRKNVVPVNPFHTHTSQQKNRGVAAAAAHREMCDLKGQQAS
jgi:hypothetical protein